MNKLDVRGLLGILWPLVAAVVGLFVVATASMELLSSVRAYCTGENLWSKGQKDAIFYLVEYARNHDPRTHDEAVRSLALPLGDHEARLTLSLDEPDFVVAERGFLQGGNHPDDVAGMIRLFRWFRRVPFMAEAIETWAEGDRHVLELRDVAGQLRAAVEGDDAARVEALVQRIDQIDAAVTPLEAHFSATLGRAARATQRLLMGLMFAAMLVLLPLGVGLVTRLFMSWARVKSEKANLEQELHIAARIQQLVLPQTFDVPGLEIAAAMSPVASVGGDYYDVLPTDDGAWLGIGDVAGHGLTSGLVMMMTQSSLAAIAAAQPRIAPREALQALNRVLYENIRRRMKKNEHVTFALLRYFRDGRVVYAGAHEELIVWRAATGRCELFDTPGTWLGGMADIGPFTVERELRLWPGDVMVLYTDGVVEAKDAQRQQFGIERLCEVVQAQARAPVSELRDSIMAKVREWTTRQDDDVSAVVLRFG